MDTEAYYARRRVGKMIRGKMIRRVGTADGRRWTLRPTMPGGE